MPGCRSGFDWFRLASYWYCLEIGYEEGWMDVVCKATGLEPGWSNLV